MEQARDHVVGMQGMTNVNEQVRRFTVAITCTRRVECKKKEDDEVSESPIGKDIRCKATTTMQRAKTFVQTIGSFSPVACCSSMYFYPSYFAIVLEY